MALACLERGESASKTGRKHIPTRLFKQAVNLSKQARAIEATPVSYTHLDVYKRQTMHNLKQMSATLMLYQQYGFSSPDELDAAISAANAATQESLTCLLYTSRCV